MNVDSRSAWTSPACVRTGSRVLARHWTPPSWGRPAVRHQQHPIRLCDHDREWARDKVARYALLTRGGEPIVWDFGSAARHHQLHSPWIRPENSRAGMLGLRGAVAPDAGLIARAVTEIQSELAAAGVASMPLGVDIAETPMLLELLKAGVEVRDAQQVHARRASDQVGG